MAGAMLGVPGLPSGVRAAPASRADLADKALVGISLDLEMSRNFPRWGMTHWDYEKGNLDDACKQYTLDACRRVKKRGGVLHSFVVGQVLEQENVDWLKEIVAEGHPLGNHTYDHVRITATKREDLAWRFQRAPWLLRDMTPRQAIEDNIRLTDAALKNRLGVISRGFRPPGGVPNGLHDRPDLQKMFLDLGFTWFSGMHPPGAMELALTEPRATGRVYDQIVATQKNSQPFKYPSGLIEIPMSPISDIRAFRREKNAWTLDEFVEATRRSLTWVIENRKVFTFYSHPSCLGIVDPGFRTIDLMCDLVEKSKGRAAIVDLDTIAQRAG